MPRALVTGITGQDGSYLAELLLAKSYEVHGIIRRSSSFNTDRIDHLYQDPHEPGRRLTLHFGDLNDASALNRILREVRPDEIYNLGAQSHVRVSFDVPEYTAEIDALGTIRLLEALREAGLEKTRFYQASSSELFGKVVETPQRETTPFYPRSPYACAKAYAFHIVRNYREAYGLFAVNGILFNHECVSAHTPLVVRQEGIVDVCAAQDLVPLRRKGRSTQTFEVPGLEVWDGDAWTGVRGITATKRRTDDGGHQVLCIEARAGVVEVTAHHRMLRANGDIVEAGQVVEGDRLQLVGRFPEAPGWTVLTTEMAELLGLLAAEGHVPLAGSVQFTNNDSALRDRVATLWRQLFLGSSREYFAASGFDPERKVGQLYLNGGRAHSAWLREQLYDAEGWKRVPRLVLNGAVEIQNAFLEGYYAGDGLQRGNGDSIKTNSAVLAQGVSWLYANLGRAGSVYAEHRGERTYYQLNLFSDAPVGDKGRHLRKDPAEVRRVVASASPSEWVFDLETESGRFAAGVGRVVVHNSPRRGETFVTRKITRAVGRIRHGLQSELYLGNLDAKRDWGWAPDYVEGMWRMLQHAEPDDFVLATGETHSVQEFVEAAFAHAGLDWKAHVRIDPRYFRPTEVDVLLGDATKARSVLGWKTTVGFEELVRRMVDADVEVAAREARAGAKKTP